jgi:hypothetical protein
MTLHPQMCRFTGSQDTFILANNCTPLYWRSACLPIHVRRPWPLLDQRRPLGAELPTLPLDPPAMPRLLAVVDPLLWPVEPLPAVATEEGARFWEALSEPQGLRELADEGREDWVVVVHGAAGGAHTGPAELARALDTRQAATAHGPPGSNAP